MRVAKMLHRILIALYVMEAASQLLGKTFIDYNNVMEIPGQPSATPITYVSDAAHCKRDCFTEASCDCAVFSLTAHSCEFRMGCRQHTVHYGVAGGPFTVFVKLPDVFPKYKEYPSRNTYTSMGSTNMASDMSEMVISHEICLARCTVNEECDCVVYKTKSEAAYSDGGCWLRKDCHPTQFGPDEGFSVFVKQRGTIAPGTSVPAPAIKMQEELERWKAKAREAEKEASAATAAKSAAEADAHSALEAAKRISVGKAKVEAKFKALLVAKEFLQKTSQASQNEKEAAKRSAEEASQKLLEAQKELEAEEAAKLAAQAKARESEGQAEDLENKATDQSSAADEAKNLLLAKEAAEANAGKAQEQASALRNELEAMKNQEAEKAARLAAAAKAEEAEKTAKAGALAKDQPHSTYWWARFWMVLFIVFCCLWSMLACIMGWCCRHEARRVCSLEEVDPKDSEETLLVTRVTELESMLSNRNLQLAQKEKEAREALDAAEKERQRLAAEEEKRRAAEAAAAAAEAAAAAAAASNAATNVPAVVAAKEYKVARFKLEKGKWDGKVWVPEGEAKTIEITHKPLGFHISAFNHTVTRVFKPKDPEFGAQAVAQGVELGMRLRCIGDPDSPGTMEDITEDHDRDQVNHKINVILNRLAPNEALAPTDYVTQSSLLVN
eukprot:TRINITY_DN3065_c0_g3_i2.p1 TRINITY_DN3065_c0_g3~~TRINITY_DN3065_c0_g3_i2.p1  ORF type:complete len:669 (-),score=163.17 TRINITY_DN3065_c0_g3_i2:98-2104(-)